MANENKLRRKLRELEDETWKEYVTTKDKVIYGGIIGAIGLLITSVLSVNSVCVNSRSNASNIWINGDIT